MTSSPDSPESGRLTGAGPGHEKSSPAAFDPRRSTFAHAGRPEPQGATSHAKSQREETGQAKTGHAKTGHAKTRHAKTGHAKTGHVGPLLVSLEERVSTLPAERILHGLRGTNVTIAYQNVDLIYDWIANPPVGFESVVGRRDEDILPPHAADFLTRAKRRCIEHGEGAQLTVELGERTPRWFDISLEPDVVRGEGDERAIEGVIVVGIEVTERVEREDRLRVLLREVSHRSRNLLAIVQSIAAQTVRVAGNPARFLDRFNERLQSLAHTLDLVTLREWEGATLHQLVQRQAAPFMPRNGSIEVDGPDAVLTPNAALHLGLAVQELASNAVNHGAWSSPDGSVDARTRQVDEDGTLIFEWIETGVGGSLDTTGSFGSRTLMAIVPIALNAEVSTRMEDEGFTYRLRIPPANFDSPANFYA